MRANISNIVGGKWWKVDFHLHTPASYDYGHGDDRQKDTSPVDFLKACRSKGLDCIVVTYPNYGKLWMNLRRLLQMNICTSRFFLELKLMSKEMFIC